MDEVSDDELADVDDDARAGAGAENGAHPTSTAASLGAAATASPPTASVSTPALGPTRTAELGLEQDVGSLLLLPPGPQDAASAAVRLQRRAESQARRTADLHAFLRACEQQTASSDAEVRGSFPCRASLLDPS